MAVVAGVAVCAVVAQTAFFAVLAVHAILAVSAVLAVLAVHAVDAVDVAILIGNEVGGIGSGSILVRHGFFSYKVSGRSFAQMMDYTRKHSRKRS